MVNSARQILQSLSLSHHANTFDEHGIESSEDVRLLSREDLSALGVVKIGEQNRICAWIKRRKVISPRTIPKVLPTQMTPLPCSQTIEDIFKDKSEHMIERYMNGSDFSRVPDAVDCKDPLCHDLFNILMHDTKLINILVKKFCKIWFKVAASKNKPMTITAIDRNRIIENAMCDFSKIAHCYCHENPVVLSSLPEELATKCLHDFRKVALVLTCKKSVDNSQGKSPSWSDRPVTRRSKLDLCVPLQHRSSSDSTASVDSNSQSLSILSITENKGISPHEAYHFWEGECSLKSPAGIFPHTQPYYKADDPLVHPTSDVGR
uniref:SAM domain-containing protein n=1 Tax=Ditylum brightwellii TaxID=49249 RepID=A0A6U3Q6A7_9STRA|mmetsp:Transcript_15114/g.22074  ORF Transcript_15114/g.22074 Transcript_15114/m.22074 type:complete len:320 (+) Transcript_15114:116-1075(+)